MTEELDFIQKLHRRANRDYLARMVPEKISCCEIAKKYGFDYWDGNRKYGYGGYKYDGRWSVLAEDLIKHFHLKTDSRILDVGCGKGFLLYELKRLLPNAEVRGFDISQYAIENAKEEIRKNLFVHNASERFPFSDNYFDLVISITTLHNLYIFELARALGEIERVGKNKYIVVESYRNEAEKFNLQCWALTAESFFTPKEWLWLYEHFGYSGDCEFIFFE